MGKSILTPTQRKFLECIQNYEEITRWFYLTGGTALSEFYLHHRFSEDIDLFSTSEVNDKTIDKFLDDIRLRLQITSVIKDHISGLFVYKLTFSNGETLKVDFNEYSFEPIEKSTKHFGKLHVDSFYDIAVNKAYTLSGRFKSRDFIDLYFILIRKEFSFEQILSRVPDKFGVQIDAVFYASQLLRAGDLPKDYPPLLVPFEFDDMVKFFVKEAKRLGKKAFK